MMIFCDQVRVAAIEATEQLVVAVGIISHLALLEVYCYILPFGNDRSFLRVGVGLGISSARRKRRL
jgi:hypothetical protein